MPVRPVARFGPPLASVLAFACVPEDPPASADGSATGGELECQTDADCPVACVDGRCVECSADEHCSNPTPICVGEVCQGCSAPHQCPNPTPICVVDDCVPCTTDADCVEIGEDVCVLEPGPDQGACTGCTSSAECPPEYPHCAESQCTLPCAEDPYEPVEPLALGDHLDGGTIAGFVCATDPIDRFQVILESGPAGAPFELGYRTLPQ